MKVLMITSEWPTLETPNAVPFIRREAEFLQKSGIDLEVFAFRGRGNLLNYLCAWYQVRRKLASDNYDLIHAQWGQSALLALPKRLPLVITFRGSDLEGYVNHHGNYALSGRILVGISRLVALSANEIIVVSKRLASRLPINRFHVIPGGLELDLFYPIDKQEARQELGLSSEERLVLFASSPKNPIKRYELAESAVAHLDSSLNVRLVVTEDVPHHRMPLYMGACDVLILTSTHEGSPNVVKEALACNLPIVSVDVGDVRERIGNLIGCVVCEDNRPSTIANALNQVLSYKHKFDGRSTVLDLDEMLIAQQIIEIYKKANGFTSQHKFSCKLLN